MIKQEEPVCLSQEGQIEEQRRQAEKQQAYKRYNYGQGR